MSLQLTEEHFNPFSLRPSFVEIDFAALEENYFKLQTIAKSSLVMPVVKANAYGHGLVRCSKTLEEIGAPFLAVAFVEEGIELRKAGIKTKILVLGGIFDNQVRYFLDYDLDLTVSSIHKLEAVEEEARKLSKKARVHLKVDTGMARIGVRPESALALFEGAMKCKHLEIISVYSHFATADSVDFTYSRKQLASFKECTAFFDDKKTKRPLFHIANTPAILKLPESHLDLVRPGLGIYGVCPSAHFRTNFDLKPVLSFKSKVVYFKVVKKGQGVSYDHDWIAPCDSRVVTIPVGYGDGYLRRLSNCAEVLIRGKRYPIIGKVCVDQFMVNIADSEAYLGDEVVLIGAQGNETIDVLELAEKAGTTPHEITIAITLRVPRVALGAKSK